MYILTEIKQLLSGGFNTAAVRNYLTISHRLTLKRCHAHWDSNFTRYFFHFVL